MATTVANFSAIDDTEVDADSPITETLVTRLRDNSYWIDPASTRTSATSNTLVLTPNQTAGTTQWQEASDVFGIDGTKGTISATINTTYQTITSKTSGLLKLDFHSVIDGSNRASFSLVVDLSDDTFVSSYQYDDAGTTQGGVFSGTITTGQAVATIISSGGSQININVRRDSGNLQIASASSGINANDYGISYHII